MCASYSRGTTLAIPAVLLYDSSGKLIISRAERHIFIIAQSFKNESIDFNNNPALFPSRCMRFDFKLIPQKDLEDLIKSVFQRVGKEYEEAAVAAIARAGAGSARDSLSALNAEAVSIWTSSII